MNMRYAIHQDSALFAFFGYDSIKVAKMFPTRCLSMVSLSLAVCVSLVVAQQSVSRVLASYYII